MQNRAVAREQERPWLEMMQRYQTFWKDVFGDLVEIVLMQADTEFDTYDADIIMQSPYIIDAQDASQSINAINESAMSGTIEYEVAQIANRVIVELLLTTYGVSDAQGMMQMEEKKFPEPVMAGAQTAIRRMAEGEIEPAQAAEYLYSILLDMEHQ
jgi:phosphatidate phosphatase APP1